MAGGTFDINVSKKRPGDYINFKSKRQQNPSGSSRGIVLIPLIGLGWGPNQKALKILASSPDAHIKALGHSVFDDNDHMLLIREALKKAMEVIVVPINPGTAATATAGGITITATYGGTRGNDIAVACVAEAGSTFAVRVYLDSEKVEEYNGLKTVADLIAVNSGEYVKFSASATSAALQAFASSNLTGGTDGSVSNSEVTKFLDASEKLKWNTMCFPSTDTALHTACISKIKYLRDGAGKYVQAVIPNCSADFEGIINVTNSVMVDGKELTVAQACAWVAAATASADKVTSNTYVEYVGASEVVGIKTNEEAELAIMNGEFFFSMSEDEKVIVEYDINSLHNFTQERTKDYSKNRVIRVYDTLAEDLKLNFPPNKYDNSEDGWLIMEGIGRAILSRYEEDGAITNVNLEEDFYVDQSRSIGDETYFNVGIQAVDSAEKLYFSISTR